MYTELKKYFKSFCLICCLILFSNCTQTLTAESINAFPQSTSENYFRKTQKIVLEVYYESGAEPFYGTTASGKQLWEVVEQNLTSIMQYRTTTPSLEVPMSIASMTVIATQSRSSWLGTDILSLSGQNRQGDSSTETSYFYIYFLKGYYNNGSGPQSSVLGVSLSGTPIIAIFKDAVKASAANPNGPVAKFVEQSTLVHEIGHALGFVNNGVPMVGTNHQDTAHGAHSTNSNCVMYWLNEGGSDLVQFVQNYITSSSFVMWGSEVLGDAQAYSQ